MFQSCFGTLFPDLIFFFLKTKYSFKNDVLITIENFKYKKYNVSKKK